MSANHFVTTGNNDQVCLLYTIQLSSFALDMVDNDKVWEEKVEKLEAKIAELKREISELKQDESKENNKKVTKLCSHKVSHLVLEVQSHCKHY